MQIWQVREITGGALQICVHWRWNNCHLGFKLQNVVSLSTMEAKYVAAIEATKEMIWLQRFLDELGKK